MLFRSSKLATIVKCSNVPIFLKKKKIALSEQNVLSYSEVWYKTSVFDVVEQNLGMYTNL